MNALSAQIEEALRPLISERDALRRNLDKVAANYVTQLAKLQHENRELRAEADAFCPGGCGRLTANAFCRDCMVHGGVSAYDRLQLAEGFLAEKDAELAKLQRENETLRAERDAAARAGAEQLAEALKSLLGNLNGSEHHPDICSRTVECDGLEPHEFCSQCGDEVCPACECGLHETQQAMQVAAAALAAHEEATR